MGQYKNKAYPLRIDSELMSKVRVLAHEEDRTTSKQLERIIRQHIEQYESEHGEIPIDGQ